MYCLRLIGICCYLLFKTCEPAYHCFALIQFTRPTDVLANSSLRLNGVYYATKQILPALDRTFSLLGVNVFQWWASLVCTDNTCIARTVTHLILLLICNVIGTKNFLLLLVLLCSAMVKVVETRRYVCVVYSIFYLILCLCICIMVMFPVCSAHAWLNYHSYR